MTAPALLADLIRTAGANAVKCSRKNERRIGAINLEILRRMAYSRAEAGWLADAINEQVQ